ncbi:phospholipase A and acyltransferase 3-like [Cololabis saira]|uniref:phospholipase A and acyltransferase 3-like n=1 Tax=Cololabis saira TaxID=129043 RepID=UPI002AD2976A|nr:phospholipase A and acyltransferase 3-like [Cololabis saira]
MSFSSCSDVSITKYFDKDKREVKPGDLIQIFRGILRHWAVYVGGGNIVHFGTAGGGSGSSGGGDNGTGVVSKEKLEDVVKKDKWRVNNVLDHKYRPRPANDIVRDACSPVDTELQYNLVTYNCEHFATEMRYGKRESQQVREAAAGIAAAGIAAAAAGAALHI